METFYIYTYIAHAYGTLLKECLRYYNIESIKIIVNT